MAAIEIEAVTRRGSGWVRLPAMLVLPVAVATIAWQFASVFYIGDLITFFLPVLAIGSLLAVAVALFLRRRAELVIALLCAGINIWPLVTPVRTSTTTAGGPSIRVATSNVLGNRSDYSSLINWSSNAGIDLLAQQEVTRFTLRRLAPLSQHFPSTPPQSVLGQSPGVMAWSTWTMSKAEWVADGLPSPDYGWGDLPMRLELTPPATSGAATSSSAKPLVVYVLHPSTPRSLAQWEYRNAYLAAVAKAVTAEPKDTPIIVLGDFNTPTWSPFYKRFVADTGLVDASGTSWPAVTRFARRFRDIGHLGAPIDHILVSPGIEVRSFELGPDVDSDHLPVIADLRLP